MKKLSIVVPVCCQKTKSFELTTVFLDSIKLYTQSENEVIIVDDGSADKEFFERIDKDILIRNETAKGFPAAVNLGIEKASGEYVVILNNDLVMTPNWDKRLIAWFEKDEKLGLLSCTTNKVDGYQNQDYDKEGVQYQYADVVTGFLMMLPRKILNELKEQSIKNKQDGYWLDRRFGLGGQCDSSLCVETKKLGYQVAIARDVFVHHVGSMSFRELFNNDAKRSIEYSKSRVDLLRKKYKNNNNMETQNSIKAQVDNTTDKPLIMIAVPSVNSEIRVELTNQLIHWSHSDRFRIRIKFITGTLPLDNARSQAVNEFMEVSNSPEDRLFFIDSDIIPPLEALDKLYDANKDIIGALCFMMKPDDKGMMVPVPVALKYDENKKYIVHFDGEGITEIDAYGLAACMIKRKVFETITERIFKFEYYPDGTLKLVGDFYACQIFQKFGFKVYCDFNTICEHIKSIGLREINNLMLNVQQRK